MDKQQIKQEIERLINMINSPLATKKEIAQLKKELSTHKDQLKNLNDDNN